MQDSGMTPPWDETCKKSANQLRQRVVQSGSYYVSLSVTESPHHEQALSAIMELMSEGAQLPADLST